MLDTGLDLKQSAVRSRHQLFIEVFKVFNDAFEVFEVFIYTQTMTGRTSDHFLWTSKETLEDVYERPDGFPVPVLLLHPFLHPVRTAAVPASLWGGTYYKNGPGRFAGVREPFDGVGIVIAISFDALTGRPSYRSRAMPAVDRARTRVAFGQNLPIKQRMSRGIGFLTALLAPLANAANTSIIPLNQNDMLACYEGAIPLVLDAGTLQARAPLQGLRAGGLPVVLPLCGFEGGGDVLCAHPRRASSSEPWVFFGIRLEIGPTLDIKRTHVTYHQVSSGPQTLRAGSFSAPGMLYAHDFVVTQSFFVFFQHPLVLNMRQVVLGGTGIAACIHSPSKTNTKGTKTHVHVTDRVTNQTRMFEMPIGPPVEPGFAFHHIASSECLTAYDSNDSIKSVQTKTVVVWHLWYPTYFVPLADCNDVAPASLVRTEIVVDMTLDSQRQREPKTQVLRSNVHWEFPTEAFKTSLPSLQFICLGGRAFDSLVRVSLSTGETLDAWSVPIQGSNTTTCFLGEPVLADGGLLLCTLHQLPLRDARGLSGAGGRATHLLIFKREDLASGPIVSLELPDVLPMGLHGCWVKRGTGRKNQS